MMLHELSIKSSLQKEPFSRYGSFKISRFNLHKPMNNNVPMFNTNDKFLQKYLLNDINCSTMTKNMYNKHNHKNPFLTRSLDIKPLTKNFKTIYFPQSSDNNKLFTIEKSTENKKMEQLLGKIRTIATVQIPILRKMASQLMIKQQIKKKKKIRSLKMPKLRLQLKNSNKSSNKSSMKNSMKSSMNKINQIEQKFQVIHISPPNEKRTIVRNSDEETNYRHFQNLIPNKKRKNIYSPWNNLKESKDQWNYHP